MVDITALGCTQELYNVGEINFKLDFMQIFAKYSPCSHAVLPGVNFVQYCSCWLSTAAALEGIVFFLCTYSECWQLVYTILCCLLETPDHFCGSSRQPGMSAFVFITAVLQIPLCFLSAYILYFLSILSYVFM